MAKFLRAFLLTALACLALAAPASAQQSGHYSLLTVTRQFTNSGATTLGTTTFSGITGTTQCLHVNSSGSLSGTGSDCGSGGGGSGTLNSVTDGTTTVSSPTQLSVTGGGAVVSNPSGSIAQIALPIAPLALEQHVASNSATLDFTTGITSGCHVYELTLSDLVAETGDDALLVEFGTGGSLPSSGWVTSGYAYNFLLSDTTVPAWNTSLHSTSDVSLTGNASVFLISATAAKASTLKFLLTGLQTSTANKAAALAGYSGYGQSGGSAYVAAVGAGYLPSTTVVTGIRVKLGAQNIASGTGTLTCAVQ